MRQQLKKDLKLESIESLAQSSAYYETRTISTNRTYNGDTTTVRSIIAYYRIDNVNLGGNLADGFSFRNSDVNFSSSDYGHVKNISAKHYQVGPDLNNYYRTVFNGNTNSNHRTNKNFNMYTKSGSAYWARTNGLYSCIIRATGTGGHIGKGYIVTFSWDLGGGGSYGHDTFSRTNGYGSLPY